MNTSGWQTNKMELKKVLVIHVLQALVTFQSFSRPNAWYVPGIKKYVSQNKLWGRRWSVTEVHVKVQTSWTFWLQTVNNVLLHHSPLVSPLENKYNHRRRAGRQLPCCFHSLSSTLLSGTSSSCVSPMSSASPWFYQTQISWMNKLKKCAANK